MAYVYLLQDSLPFLPISDGRELHFTHLLHFLIHVNLLFKLLDLRTQQSYRVLAVVLTGDNRGAG